MLKLYKLGDRMVETIRTLISEWAEQNEDRNKLQHVYLILAGALIIVAGLASLLNPELGRTLVGYSLGALGIFTVNAIVWAILYSTLYPKARPNATKRTKK